jgi:sortase A
MGKKIKNILKKPTLSTVLILTGGLLISFTLIAEAIEYPWISKVDEAELPDPPLPGFSVYLYTEYVETKEVENVGRGIAEFEMLPGGNQVEPMPEAITEPEAETDRDIQRYVLMGSVKIPRINISENLFMGTGRQINHGIGHLEGTPLPGEEGNAVIAAHRVSTTGKQSFRHLDKLQTGDTVIVNLSGEIFVYEVYDNFIVNENDLWVLQSVENETYLLTLVTCDPVFTVTNRENRLIVRARLKE